MHNFWSNSNMYTQGNWMTASFMWNICLRKQILRPKILWAWERLFISTWLFHFFFVCFSFYIYFLKIFESWVLFTFIFTSYIWLLSSERAPKIFVFENSYRYRGLKIYCFREPLHVSNVSAFREKWRKWQSVRNALRIPGFIVQINKLIVPLIRMFTVELLPL